MDNNNNQKRSPLEEIKRVTSEANGRRAQTPPPAPQRPPQAQRPAQGQTPPQTPRPAQGQRPPQAQRPVQGQTPQGQKPAQTPQRRATNDYGLKGFNPASTDPSAINANLSRADKVRMARENAQRAREATEAEHTRVMNTADVNPEKAAEEERLMEEARRLVRSNMEDPSATRVTKAVKPEPIAKKPKKEKSEMDDEFEETVGKGVLSNTVKAIIYIVSVLVASGCLALFIIFVGNDCFAFVKSDVDVVVTLPEGADLGDIAKELKSNDVIKYPSMFKLYVNLRNKDSDNYIAGSHTVNGMMSYDQLIAAFKPSSSREEVRITIVEGSTTQEIIDLFVSKGIGTQEGFVDAIQNYDFDFWFIDELESTDISDRIYRLDGYLFPDTYNFYTDSSEADALYKLLANFEAKFPEENRARAQELGMTVDDIVTLASIIQKEAMYITDYPLVSSVFHNRLDAGMKLESNATVQYTMPTDEVELKLSYDQITKYDNGYNTYLYADLPAGPICNSSLNALNWALYPNDTDYLYFVSDAEGYNHYAVTYNEHLRNVEQYQGD